VAIRAGRVVLAGDLAVPPGAMGIVVFAHGSGSSRLSPRNRIVAEALVERGFATLLFDLLTEDEEIAERFTRHLRFDIPLLAERLSGAIVWLGARDRVADLPVGLFGASTGAAAALIASTVCTRVHAVVSRGGRPDLAGETLRRVRCPTLLVVGAADRIVLALNQRALEAIPAPTRMHVVPRAGHLFEEPGAMGQVIAAASAWFQDHLARSLPRGDAELRQR
jgi:pimeloyl-ACP methyl ester carboxylesterase